MNPTGPSAAEAASDELNSGRIIAEEQQLPRAGLPTQEGPLRVVTQVIYLMMAFLFLTSLVHIMIFSHYIIFFQFLCFQLNNYFLL